MSFTIVFPGLIRKFAGNPFDAETPFGKAQTVAIGDACEQCDIMRAALEQIADDVQQPAELARQALREISDLIIAETKLASAAAAKEASGQ